MDECSVFVTQWAWERKRTLDLLSTSRARKFLLMDHKVDAPAEAADAPTVLAVQVQPLSVETQPLS